MFGMPNNHPLSSAVEVLTRPHMHTLTGGTMEQGVEEALLVTLGKAVASTSGKGSAAGGTRTGSPVDLGAMTLLDSIAAVVHANVPSAHDPIARCRPVSARLISWAEQAAGDPTEEDILLEHCRRWIYDIRRYLEPPKEVPLRGVACSNCGVFEVYSRDEDGDVVAVPALTAYASESPVRVTCGACETSWEGEAGLSGAYSE